MSNEQDKHDPGDDLDLQLRQLLKRIQDEPVSEELRCKARELEDALTKHKISNGRD